jgi:hypoxanthine phosphoribosyltransferase
MCKDGPSILHIYDIHAPPTCFYYNTNMIVKQESATPLLLNIIDRDDTTIAFPDEGAFKRFKDMFPDFRIIICSKVREGDNRKIRIVDKEHFPKYGDTNLYDTNVLIVDDLVQSGSTLESCRAALEEAGYKHISAYVTHAIFPNDTWKKIIDSKFEKFYITDSVPEITEKLKNKKPFEIINLFSPNIISYNVMVASVNNDKLRAVHDALIYKNYDKSNPLLYLKIFNIYGIGVPSYVSEQPVDEETDEGCINRLNNLKKYIEEHDFQKDIKPNLLVSIENGIYKKKTNYCSTNLDEPDKEYIYVDEPCVAIENSYGDYKLITAIDKEINEYNCDNCVEVPEKYYLKMMETNKQITVGKIVEQETGIPEKNWHCSFNDNKRTRIDFITTNICNNGDGVIWEPMKKTMHN